MNKQHVIYITTALKDEDFNVLVKEGKNINPAGQNFHARVISALEKTCEITVISIPPAWSSSLKEENGVYHYSPAPKGKLAKYFVFPSKVISSIKFEEAPIIIYDSMNVLVSKIAGKLSRTKGLKKVAVLTDNPANITGVSSSYVETILKESSDADGYIALSNGLISLFNKEGRPSVLFEGIVDSASVEPTKREGPYFYFGGALFERYGIKSMISAFMASKSDYQLLIAGHGQLENEIKEAAKIDTRILYLGQVSKEENMFLEKGASLLINPRPFTDELDKNSVPSKLLEYLSTGNPILSTKHTALFEKFGEYVNWIDGKDVEKEMYAFFKAHLDNEGKLIDLANNNSQDSLSKEFGEDVIGNKVSSFLSSL